MGFFKTEDFHILFTDNSWSSHAVTDIANKVLEQRGKVVYGTESKHEWTKYKRPKPDFISGRNTESCFTALLINIEPIKKPCEHPSDKIKFIAPDCASIPHGYFCECGARVVPSVFEEFK